MSQPMVTIPEAYLTSMLRICEYIQNSEADSYDECVDECGYDLANSTHIYAVVGDLHKKLIPFLPAQDPLHAYQ